ncbi:MAG: hypothetical protein B7Z66_02180 [Chromatiales bacterium 21-64-14]|nr:MAG: hypothetical protein B7Z66_02180 [Chromatiales bacterium 21-64-14]HQU16492.1 TetR/AcrR family transcriptional regulator [Gammaproteobacteria bacterium]
MATEADARNRILDAALVIADARSWEAVRLAEAARDADIPLAQVPTWFREKEDLVDAWFARADQALLRDAATRDCQGLAPRARMHRGIMTWLGALAPHRRVTRQMVLGRLEPGHLHTQYRALRGVSRTVQWLREAAGRDARYPWRAVEETVLTGIFMTTFTYWLWDDSADAVRSARLLDRLLRCAEPMARVTPLGARPATHRPGAEDPPRRSSKTPPPAGAPGP